MNKAQNSSFLYKRNRNIFENFNFNRSFLITDNNQRDFILDNLGIKTANDITLDDKIKKKFFTYSLMDLYNKLFEDHSKHNYDPNQKIFADYNIRNNIMKEYTITQHKTISSNILNSTIQCKYIFKKNNR